jgi:hypothetical protein
VRRTAALRLALADALECAQVDEVVDRRVQATVRTGHCAGPITVQMPGGEMRVEVAPDWSVRLTGTVEFVCYGEVTVM